MRFWTDTSSRAIPTGMVPILALALAGLAWIPSAAFGHAGEVHSEPAPTVTSPAAKPKSGSKATVSGKAPKPKIEADAVAAQASGASPDAPPPPEVPDSDPALHFVLLGAVAVLGTGLIFMRRRSALD